MIFASTMATGTRSVDSAKEAPSWFHRCFAVLGLVTLSECGFRVIMLPFGGDSFDDMALPYLVVTSLIYLLAGLFAAARLPALVVYFAKNIPLFALLMLAITSILWSVDPETTGRRIIALAGTMIFACYLAVQFENDEVMRLLLWVFGAIAVVSFLSVLLFPNWAIHRSGSHSGKWRGLYDHKSGMGREMALAAILFAVFAPKGRLRWLFYGISAIAMIMVVNGKSAQGQMLIAFLIPIGLVLRRLIRLDPAILCGCLLLGTIGTATMFPLVDALEPLVLGAAGRDETLTGRTEIWERVIAETLRDYAVLGHGYTGDLQLEDADEDDGHAHNGYVQLFSELGFAGIFMFAAASLVLAFNILTRVLISRTDFTVFLIIFPIYFYLLSYVASPILEKNSALWLLFVFVCLKASEQVSAGAGKAPCVERPLATATGSIWESFGATKPPLFSRRI